MALVVGVNGDRIVYLKPTKYPLRNSININYSYLHTLLDIYLA
jgi:hypothetical protein